MAAQPRGPRASGVALGQRRALDAERVSTLLPMVRSMCQTVASVTEQACRPRADPRRTPPMTSDTPRSCVDEGASAEDDHGEDHGQHRLR